MKPKRKSGHKGRPTEPHDVLRVLFVASAELQGVGRLMSSMHDHTILNQDDAAYGIGQILLESAADLQRARSAIDERHL